MKARIGISPFFQFIFIEAFLTDQYTYFERQSCGRGKHRFSVRDPRAPARVSPKKYYYVPGATLTVGPCSQNGGFCLQMRATETESLSGEGFNPCMQ